MKIRISGLVNDSIVDGPGLRYVVFVQGCKAFCPHCHNPATHDMNGGIEIDTSVIIDEIKNNKLIEGVTFSGGEPFLQPTALVEIAKVVKELGLNLIVYTGQYYNLLRDDQNCLELIKLADYIIDGPFDYTKKSMSVKYRGSSNQRIINAQKSIKLNRIVTVEDIK